MFDAPAPVVDLDAYFGRIGYDGPRAPTLETLRAIAVRHPDAIPFENLDVLLGRGISIIPADIDAKLIGGGRGGYCYEQNGLLKRVLQALGFQVEGLMARVLWMAPEGAPPRPRSHQVLGVTIPGEFGDGETWLVDAGFGGCVLTAPLRLFSDAVQDTPHGKFRILDTQTDGVAERQVQADLSGRWVTLYQVSRGAWAEVDYEQANFFTYTHPSSHFTWSMTVGRTTPTARYALKNNRFTHRDLTGAVVEQRDLSVDELEATLRDVIGLPVEADWKPVLEKVVAWGDASLTTEWEDEAYVLSARSHGETGAIVELLTESRGKFAAHVAGAASRRMKPFLQPGARVIARYRARVSDQLGSANLEPMGEGPSSLFDDRLALAGLSAAAAVAAAALPEREAHPGAFHALETLIRVLEIPEIWPAVYVRYEAGLLQELGFGLDLSKCAATGTFDDLVYVSPRTGRAVSRAAGRPYHDKLLPLPPFMLSSQGGLGEGDVKAGLDITGHFLEQFVFGPLNRPLPPARVWLLDRLGEAGRL